MKTALLPNYRRMKLKFTQWVLPLILIASAPMQAYGDSSIACKSQHDPGNLITDVVIVRPFGAAGTLAGAALFIGMTPLTALADIPEPHDAFQRLGGLLVGVPYAYTFLRPLGNFGDACE